MRKSIVTEIKQLPGGYLTEIKQLPSGYWSVWINGNWIEASCASELEARQVLETYMQTIKGGKHR